MPRLLPAFVLAFAAALPCPAAPLRVVTLSTVLTEIAREVGGPDVTVQGVLAPGVDPHTFEPAPADLRAITEADLVLASGLGMENYLDRITANSGTRARIAEAGGILAATAPTAGSRGRPETDPHWWNSIAATTAVTRWVAAQFSALRPGNAAGFAGRASAYAGRLAALDAWTRGRLAAIPAARRELVTTHNAFGWFARDYGFSVHAISGLSTEAEPDARGFAALAELIRRDRIPAVFPEAGENFRLAAALARETGARLGDPLYADGLVPAEDGGTYAAMFRHNVRAIAAGLR